MGVSRKEVAVYPVRQTNPFRLVSVARLIHWKGVHLGLKAFSRFGTEFGASEYWLIGEGPERKPLERLAQDLGVANRVIFCGALPRTELLEKFADFDVLVHPALHDSAPSVCLEAMAAGRPVICLDLGGPALQVTEETGFKIAAITPEQVVNDLAQAMLRLAREPDLRRKMGEAGRKRVAESFAWEKKGEWMNEMYQTISIPCDS
jgi:glycosyltransferase involved in cell wall biosynthesis